MALNQQVQGFRNSMVHNIRVSSLSKHCKKILQLTLDNRRKFRFLRRLNFKLPTDQLTLQVNQIRAVEEPFSCKTQNSPAK